MKRGFAAMAAVLIIAAISIAVISTTALLAIGSGQSALALVLGEGNLQQAESCAEDVLEGVRDNAAFSRTTITRPEGTCNISYTATGPVDWDISIGMLSGDYNRRVQIKFTRNATGIGLISWQEI